MASTFEILNGILFVTGSLDRASDQELAQALEKYGQTVAPASRVVDMSNVRWLAPTGAKALIAAGQETAEKGGNLRVMASRHVLQTLNLLGAKSWLSIESCMSPNPRPAGAEQPVVIAEAVTPAEAEAAKAAAETPAHAAAGASAAPSPAPSAHESGAVHAAVAVPSHAVAPPPSYAAPAARGGAFASLTEELTGGANLLRMILPNRRYSFHLEGGELMIGIIRERVGGPWVLVETAGTRKILSLDRVIYVEVL